MISWKVFLFFLYTFILAVLLIETPNKIAYIHQYPYIFGLIGIIGIYRYGLWLVHFIRAQLYEKYYAKLRKKADSIPESEWKPARLYFMLVSYLEEKEILYNSVRSIVHEARNLQLPATICMGTANPHDEKIVSEYLETTDYEDRIKVIFIRQNAPNKRLQIGKALRAMMRQGIEENDPIIFMDGDSLIAHGCLRKCLPVLYSQPDVDAITTNEKAAVTDSKLLSNVFNLRFAIRNFHMHSIALSKKVLCLTGRFTIFRGSKIANEEFISRVEYDHIQDWYWDKIDFLSGDDKSTWYTLLKNGSNMLYIPDALVYSIEKVKGQSFRKYMGNLRRWGGNMLRNNARALKLGPCKTRFFPWFILIDQRISMWTALLSPSLIILMFFRDITLTYMIIIWVLTVRYLQSLLLFYYGNTINGTFPILLYFNQVLNGLVKIYMLFHLNVQRWNNQGLESSKPVNRFKVAFADYITVFYIVLFVLIVNELVF